MPVTCIMPTANRRRLVPGAIACFLDQDYPDRELVVVDDGADAVGGLVRDDHRVWYVLVAAGLTLGAKPNLVREHARGDVIPHRDDNDWYLPSQSLAAAAQEWKTLKELANQGEFEDSEGEAAAPIKDDLWNPRWIPVASNSSGDFFWGHRGLALNPGEGLPGGCWLTVFGPELVAFFRRERLLALDAHRVLDRSDSGIGILLYESPVEGTPEFRREREAALVAGLGPEYFFNLLDAASAQPHHRTPIPQATDHS
jgi:hypothetical protein